MHRSARGNPALALAVVLCAAGCHAFDQRWTEIAITAEPSLIGPRSELGYCIWASGATEGDSGEGALLRPVTADPCDRSAAPVPGTLIIENQRGTDAAARAFFQLRVTDVSPAVIPCRRCPPDLGALPADSSGAERLCLTSDRFGRFDGEPIDVSALYETVFYRVHFDASGAVVERVMDGTDGGEPIPSCSM
jgi:hypothetical protein